MQFFNRPTTITLIGLIKFGTIGFNIPLGLTSSIKHIHIGMNKDILK